MRLLLIALALAPLASAQWQLQTSNTTASLRGIHAVTDQIAWASGTAGTVLHTTDGGQHWLPCTTPPQAEHLDFRGIQAFDAQTAIVMSSGKGDLSRLYKTTNACQSWTLVFTNPDSQGFWDALQFYDHTQAKDRRNGLVDYGVLVGDAVGNRFSIWTTNDKGSTWSRWNDEDSKHPPKAKRKEALFAASNGAAVVPGPDGGFAFVTGGSEARLCAPLPHSHFALLDTLGWSQLDCKSLPMNSSESAGAFALAERPHGSIQEDFLVVGGDYKLPDQPSKTLYLPNFAGQPIFMPQDIQRSTTPPHGYRSAVAYAPTHKAWITVGPNGTDLSTDDGRNWHPLRPAATGTPDEDKNWNALSLPFVVGPNGRIGHLRPTALP